MLFVLCVCVILSLSRDACGLLAEEMTTELCCNQGTAYARNHTSDDCSSSIPPDVPSLYGSLCIFTMDQCCKEYFQKKQECYAGIDAATNTGKCMRGKKLTHKCCAHCQKGHASGLANGHCQRSGGNSAEELLAGDAFLHCCKKSSGKEKRNTDSPTVSKKASETGFASICEDYAPNELCAHHCIPVPGSYRCECNPGYMLMSDGRNCKEVVKNRCKPRNPCQHKCNDNGVEVKCSCRRGYQLLSDGKKCGDIDECLLEPSVCLPGTQCHNIQGSYKCIPVKKNSVEKGKCPAGFSRNLQNNACDDVNECLLPNPPCPSYLCENTIGGYKCGGVSGDPINLINNIPPPPTDDRCPPGFKSGFSEECEDIDECLLGKNNCNQQSQFCINTRGSFFCQDKASKHCHPGFKINPATNRCEDINECEDGEDICRPDQICVNVPGEYDCKPKNASRRSKNCPEGMRMKHGSIVCEDIDECVEGTHLCDQYQNCLNTNGSHECHCKLGFEHDIITGACSDVNECATGEHNCHLESQRCDNTIGSFLCIRFSSCGTGYILHHTTGKCEDVDECALGTHNCQRAGPDYHCENKPGSFRCVRRRTTTSTTTTAMPEYEYYYDSEEEVENETDAKSPENKAETSTSSTNKPEPTTSSTTSTTTTKPPPVTERKPDTPKSPEENVDNNTIEPEQPEGNKTPYNPQKADIPVYKQEVPPYPPPEQPRTPDSPVKPSWQPEPNYPPTQPTQPEQPLYPDPIQPKIPEQSVYPTPPQIPSEPSNYPPIVPTTDRPKEPEKPILPPTEPSKQPEESYHPPTGPPSHSERPYYPSPAPKQPEEPIYEPTKTTDIPERPTYPPTEPSKQPDPGSNDSIQPEPFPETSYVPVPTEKVSPTPPELVYVSVGEETATVQGERKEDGSVFVDTRKLPKNEWTKINQKPVNCQYGFELNEFGACYDIDECATDRHSCSRTTETCRNTLGGYLCECASGYRRYLPTGSCIFVTSTSTTSTTTSTTLPPTTTSEKSIDECATDRHSCSRTTETCRNTLGGYVCECASGYRRYLPTGSCIFVTSTSTTSTTTSTTLPPTTLSEKSTPRFIFGYQENTVKNRPFKPFGGCDAGYHKNSRTGNCEDINECTNGQANCASVEICVNTEGGYKCECPPNWKLDNIRHRCMPVYRNGQFPPGYANAPEYPPVDPQEVITNSGNDNDKKYVEPEVTHVGDIGSVIKCPWGYKLGDDNTCQDIDECLTGDANCGPQQICNNLAGGYTCSCPRGHRLVGDHRCEDVNECTLAGSVPICSQNADCLNTIGSYQCQCHKGFVTAPLNDKVCLDVDECTESRSGSLCQQRCNNVWGGYRCSCHRGYRLNADNRTCSDVDECTEFKSKTLCVGRCYNEPGSYRCACPSGYRLSEDKRSCIDIDECETGIAPCANGGVYGGTSDICLNTRGGYRCHRIQCPPGYQLENKHRCNKISRQCSPTDWYCAHQPTTYSYNFITFVSKLYIPDSKVDLFTMRGPSWPNAKMRFELRLVDVNAPPTVKEKTDINAFLLIQSGNQAVASLVKSLEGPQSIELELSMELYSGEQFGGTAVAKIFIFVSEYEF